MSYITPITDRTEADVNYVKSLNKRIAQNGWSTLSLAERTDWLSGLKGALNYNDLNRIEGNTEWLKDTLEGYGYTMPSLTFLPWSEADIPTTFTRIMTNLSAIADAWNNPSQSLPDELSDYNDVNDIEKFILELKQLISLMEQSFRYCGATICGGGKFERVATDRGL